MRQAVNIAIWTLLGLLFCRVDLKNSTSEYIKSVVCPIFALRTATNSQYTIRGYWRSRFGNAVPLERKFEFEGLSG